MQQFVKPPANPLLQPLVWLRCSCILRSQYAVGKVQTWHLDCGPRNNKPNFKKNNHEILIDCPILLIVPVTLTKLPTL